MGDCDDYNHVAFHPKHEVKWEVRENYPSRTSEYFGPSLR